MCATDNETSKSSTPILDRLAPLPEVVPARSGLGGGLLGGLVVGAGIGIVFALWHPPFVQSLRHAIVVKAVSVFPGPWTVTRGLSIIAVALLLSFAVVALHELGHVLAGLAAGFRIHQVRIGPLLLHVPFRISRYRGPGAWFSGGVSLLPINDDRLPVRAMAMVVAGPVANLLSGGAILLLPFAKGFASWLFLCASIAGGLVELLVPFGTPTGPSDAKLLLMLLRGREQAERWLALMKLGAELSDGVSPEWLSRGFLAKAVAIRDNSPDTVTGHAFAYAAAFWQNKDTEAAQFLETCLQYSAHASAATREALMSDASVFQARKRKRADLAEQWLDSLPQVAQVPWLRIRAEAGILEARGDVQGALGKLDEVEKKLLAAANSVQREIFLRFLRRWQSELRGT